MSRMSKPKNRVLLVGSGGREHAIAWKLSQSERVEEIFVAPGNAGMSQEKKVKCVSLSPDDSKEVANWCLQNRIDMVVVGPEGPLSNGMVDEMNSQNIPVFGPRRAAAQLEASKHFSKSFMERHHIPTAKWKAFKKAKDAKTFIQSAPFNALVVKASGLAAGKGVIVASTPEEACDAVDTLTEILSDASETIIVEELLEGEEVSVLAFTDGRNVKVMLPAQDHKRLIEGDVGPNTGGMGAYCPCPLLSDDDLKYIEEHIIKKTILGLKTEGVRYVGVLYAGLIITNDGPKVLEFNCRFGDPETQVILPLMESDLYDAFEACINGTLDTYDLRWIPNMYNVGVVMASAGYPGSYLKGKVIKGIQLVTTNPGYAVFHAGTKLVDGKFVTSGGRVLIAVALGNELALAAAKALKAVNSIQFDGAHYRQDIAKKGIARSLLKRGQMTYKDSGVNIDAGDSLVKNILALAETTTRDGCMGNIGGFGGFFDLKLAGYKDPYLVSGTDGVGTKLKIAEAMDIHDSVGIDLVAMCVNDILAHAAEPLYFLDYFACGKLDVDTATKVVIGITEGCRQAGCALIGGETAEMPGVYERGVYDLAGFAVGAVERGKQLPFKDKIEEGDVIFGLGSTGPHSNGFSLIRRVVHKNDLRFDGKCPYSKDSGKTLGEELLTPTKIYVKSVLPALRSGKVKAFAHITGGGLIENIPRVLPKNLKAELDAESWPVQPVFGWIAGAGGISEMEMMRTFNCGLGAVMIVSEQDRTDVLRMITEENVYKVGHIRNRFGDDPNIEVKNMAKVLAPMMKPFTRFAQGDIPKKRVAVLISGTGTNLKALIDHTQDVNVGSNAEIVLVISNKPGVEGLKKAEDAGIPTKVIVHKEYPTREEFDKRITQEMEMANVDLVCLAGFMRILSESFVKRWHGRLLNIHPSLLPSFKGANAHEQAIAAGVKVSGCSVHFVEVEVDAGAIIVQEPVPVLPGDTIEMLQERIKKTEHYAYPKALEIVARNKASLDAQGKIVWNY